MGKVTDLLAVVACSNCKSMGNYVTRNGIMPECKKRKKKFKERKIFSYYDKDIIESKCSLFEHYKT